MDWGMWWALKIIKGWNEGNKEAIETVNLIYDIMCQYCIHFKSRMERNYSIVSYLDVHLRVVGA